MLKFVESIVLFVPDVDAAAHWYAEVLGAQVAYENPHYAYVHGPGITLGFHPADGKCPGGVGGTTAYWEVDDIAEAVRELTARGARLHRGPAITSLGAGAAMLIDPFGCSIGLNASTPGSRATIEASATPPAAADGAA